MKPVMDYCSLLRLNRRCRCTNFDLCSSETAKQVNLSFAIVYGISVRNIPKSVIYV